MEYVVLNDKNEIITYDWRSPICSMYYDYNIGNAEYEYKNIKEKGKIISTLKDDVELKRAVEILLNSNGKNEYETLLQLTISNAQ